MTELGTSDDVPEAELILAHRVQGRSRRVVGWSMFALLAGLFAAGVLIKVDYVALVPGSARDTEPLITGIVGAESFPSDGEILFTTVRVRQDPNIFEYLWSRFDDDAELVPEERIFGDRSPEENREVNLQLMTDSKSIAVAVALEQLGYDTITSDGVVVAEIISGSAAEGVLELGDTIVSVDNVAVPAALDLIELLSQRRPGSTLSFVIQRDGSAEDEETIEVVMGAREDNPDAAFLGIGPVDRISVVQDSPIQVELDSGSVGGPSAGLAFTLAILDQLTPGDLTGGADVAVTGTIEFDGRIGPVGGVLQKTAAVEELGLKYFIVPRSLGEENLAEIVERAGPDLEIIPVDSLDEALEVLEGLGGDIDVIEDFAAAQG